MAQASQRQVWMIEQMPIRPDDRVLELGCGHGVAASEICARLDGGAYVGVDRSAAMTAAATARNRGHVDAGRAVFLTAPVAEAELSGVYDWVVAIHLPVLDRGDPSAELARVRRHMGPRSRLCVGFQPLDPRAVDAAVLRLDGVLAAGGLSVESTVVGAPDGRPAAVVTAGPADVGA